MTHSSHAALDLGGRKPKAEKIHRLLPLPTGRETAPRLLEAGTGSGAIAQYFSELTSPRFDVWAVDVEDQRVSSGGYQFHLYDGRHLPFGDEFFDVVISNHVIEHVGDRAQQACHLAELCRVLAPGGYIYLATPSRWQIVEPHFSLPFLSWIPRGWRDLYVRLAGRGEKYDCDLLRPVELRRLLQSSGLPHKNLNARAFRELVALERPQGVLARVASLLPSRWLERLRNLSPTLIYLIHKPQHSDKIIGNASNQAPSLPASWSNRGE
ncbi:MAG: methyltransferase domain-containing protein [Gammaproteobacteria bacterium]